TDANVEYAARRILAAIAAKQSASADVGMLLGQQNADGGWGFQPGYQSNPLDTAVALQALRATNASPAAGANGLAYLTGAKLADGGWDVSNTSSVYVTANVLLAANAWSSQSASSALAAAASAWLLGARSAAQDFGNAFNNACALLALATQAGQSA